MRGRMFAVCFPMSNAVDDILALIPARGGSKGLPQKNILPCGGRPLIAHTIAAALGARPRVRRVVVSTDDPAIAKVSREAGAEVPFVRPDVLASDTAKSIDVAAHALSWFPSWRVPLMHVNTHVPDAFRDAKVMRRTSR